MSDHTHSSHVSRHLHRWVYGAIGGLGLLYLLAAWVGFGGIPYTDYLLFIVSLFIIGSIALPLAASSFRGGGKKALSPEDESLAEWARGDVDTATGRVSGGTAIVEILLPIGAIAIGMTLFAIVALAMG
jgi:hypothetical protein